MRQPAKKPLGEVIIELRQNGAYVKVTAIHAETGVEISTLGSASSPPAILEQAAMRKLAYVLENRKGPARPERGLLI